MADNRTSGPRRRLDDEYMTRSIEARLALLEKRFDAHDTNDMQMHARMISVIETQQSAVLGARVVKWFVVVGAATAAIITFLRGFGK